MSYGFSDTTKTSTKESIDEKVLDESKTQEIPKDVDNNGVLKRKATQEPPSMLFSLLMEILFESFRRLCSQKLCNVYITLDKRNILCQSLRILSIVRISR